MSEVDATNIGSKVGWHAGLSLLLVIALVLLVFHETALSIVSVWNNSETYAHGWVIVPIALWLIWRQRDSLSLSGAGIYWPGVIAMLASVVLWVCGEIVGVQLAKHFALLFMVWAVTWTMLGRAAGQLAFPLGYLVFAVPFGEMLVPTLMDITAAFSVTAVRLSGIPVFRDGMYFSLPSGDFEVAAACSGIRYLIASAALGTLYAYLSFVTLWKRLVFMLLSLLVPIVANGIRAYMIVIIAHLSDLKLAVGIDHFIYGWVFFGIVMFILFVIGARFSEQPQEQLQQVVTHGNRVGWPVRAAAVLVLAGMVLAAPGVSKALQTAGVREAQPPMLPQAMASWSGPGAVSVDFSPGYHGASSELAGRYTSASGDVFLFIYFYPADRQAELIQFRNSINNEEWDREDNGRARQPGMLDHAVVETPLRNGFRELLTWHWFDVNGYPTTSRSRVKWYKLADTLRGRYKGASLIALIAEEKSGSPDALLRSFLETHQGVLQECLIADLKENCAGR